MFFGGEGAVCSSCQKSGFRAGVVRKKMENKTAIIMLSYKSIMELHLEYSVQFWSPLLKKASVEIELIQKRTTKMILVE